MQINSFYYYFIELNHCSNFMSKYRYLNLHLNFKIPFQIQSGFNLNVFHIFIWLFHHMNSFHSYKFNCFNFIHLLIGLAPSFTLQSMIELFFVWILFVDEMMNITSLKLDCLSFRNSNLLLFQYNQLLVIVIYPSKLKYCDYFLSQF